ncbi:MAG: hypothetical protein HW406_1867 [Candidatus Brocadiaceae bacterium]|nr:hypothetical protein [Candidatus Brocadiaceae bacterium]
MIKLVIVRHGESIWNYENIFTGWTDIDLSDNGVAEANFVVYFRRNGFNVDTRIQIMEIE